MQSFYPTRSQPSGPCNPPHKREYFQCFIKSARYDTPISSVSALAELVALLWPTADTNKFRFYSTSAKRLWKKCKLTFISTTCTSIFGKADQEYKLTGQ